MRTFEKTLWGVGFFVLPFIFSLSPVFEQMREPKVHFLIFLAGVYLSSKLAQKVSLILGCAAFVAFFSAVFITPNFPSASLLTLFAALYSCLFIADLGKNDIERGLEIFECSAIACAAYAMVLQLKHADPILHLIEGADYRRVMVFFGQHTLYGPFCVAGMASALFRGRFYRAILLATPIFFIDASFTYLSAAVVVALFLVRRFGIIALAGTASIGLLSAVYFFLLVVTQNNVKTEAFNDNGRFPLWKLTFRIARARPIFGHGLGSFATEFQVFQKKQLREAAGINDDELSPEVKQVIKEAEELKARSGIFLSPHNEVLSSFYELGIFGPILCFALVYSFFLLWFVGPMQNVDWALAAIFFSFCANGLGNFSFHLIPQALLPLWAYVAVTGRCKEIRLKI